MPEPEEMGEEAFDALLESSSLGSPRVKAVRASGEIPPWVRLAFQLATAHPFTLTELAALTWADTIDYLDQPER